MTPLAAPPRFPVAPRLVLTRAPGRDPRIRRYRLARLRLEAASPGAGRRGPPSVLNEGARR